MENIDSPEAVEGTRGMSDAKDSQWKELTGILADLKKRYDALLILLKKKEKLIIDGDDSRLAKMIKEEEKQINEIEKVENERIQAASACGQDAEQAPTLKELLEIAPEEDREQLEKTAVSLLESMNKVSAANHSVAEMVKEAMNFVNYQINLMGSDSARDNIYEGSGRMKDAKPKIKGIINREA